MSVIKKMRKQTAVYWARTTSDHYGRFSYQPPVEVKCRWDDTIQEFVNATGEKQASRAVAYVDTIMVPGDRIKRGVLETDTPLDPLSIDDAFEIRRFDQIPNFRATETLLVAYM